MLQEKSFNEKCYSLLKKVPRGKVTTYKEISRKLKSKGYRAVGNAMNKNPYAPKVACHRVVKSNGEIGGFAERLCEIKSAKRNVKGRAGLRVSGTKKKIEMLKKEGVEIRNGRIDLGKFGFRF